jgi:hypothetical protein
VISPIFTTFSNKNVVLRGSGSKVPNLCRDMLGNKHSALLVCYWLAAFFSCGFFIITHPMEVSRDMLGNRHSALLVCYGLAAFFSCGFFIITHPKEVSRDMLGNALRGFMFIKI